MVKHKFRVMSYELRVGSLKARVESSKARAEIQKCEFESTSYELKPTSSRIFKKSMKTQVNRVLKSSSFPKIITPKLFGNLRGFWN